jgi:outer membrane protein assembly factor BamB
MLHMHGRVGNNGLEHDMLALLSKSDICSCSFIQTGLDYYLVALQAKTGKKLWGLQYSGTPFDAADVVNWVTAVAGTTYATGRTSGELFMQKKVGTEDVFVQSVSTLTGEPLAAVQFGIAGGVTSGQCIQYDTVNKVVLVAGQQGTGTFVTALNPRTLKALWKVQFAADELATISSCTLGQRSQLLLGGASTTSIVIMSLMTTAAAKGKQQWVYSLPDATGAGHLRDLAFTADDCTPAGPRVAAVGWASQPLITPAAAAAPFAAAGFAVVLNAATGDAIFQSEFSQPAAASALSTTGANAAAFVGCDLVVGGGTDGTGPGTAAGKVDAVLLTVDETTALPPAADAAATAKPTVAAATVQPTAADTDDLSTDVSELLRCRDL